MARPVYLGHTVVNAFFLPNADGYLQGLKSHRLQCSLNKALKPYSDVAPLFLPVRLKKEQKKKTLILSG